MKLLSTKYAALFIKLLLSLLLAFAFAKYIVKNLGGPVYGYADTNHWEYTGFYFYENLKFTPFPTLNLRNNVTLYPFGGNMVFQSWAFEKDYFYMLCYQFFNSGPWLKYYYLFTVILLQLVTYLILRKDFGKWKAWIASCTIYYFNFYALLKYPYHFSYATLHWVTIGYLLDFTLYYRFNKEHLLDFQTISFRIISLFLSLGLELGYVAGFGFLSFIFVYGIIFLEILWKREIDSQLVKPSIQFLKTNRLFSLISLALIFLCAFLYFPILISIAGALEPVESETKIFWWSNPARLFLPHLPGFNFLSDFKSDFFGDNPEGPTSGSPGWLMLLLAGMGLWQSRRSLKVFAPFIFIFVLFLSYHPTLFPVLKIFPWFHYFRVSGRVTLVYSTILVIFFMGFNFNSSSMKARTVTITLLAILALIEVRTVYKTRLAIDATLPSDFKTYINLIKNSRGEAILDWPFCIFGADGERSLCPYFPQTSTLYALRRFHEKKVVGQYFGRMNNKMRAPFKQMGWEQMFLVDENSNPLFPVQKRCFNEREWMLFSNFYQSHDFAGINLYLDIVGEACAAQFYQRFGKPAYIVSIPYSGRIAWIQRNRN